MAAAPRRAPAQPKLPPDRLSLTAEKRHQQRLRGYIAKANRIVRARILPLYERLWRQQWGPQRLDADAFGDLDEAMQVARIEFERVVTPADVEALAAEGAAGTVRAQGAALKAQIKTLIGVDPLLNDSLLALEIQSYRDRNVKLINSISDRYFSEIDEAVQEALTLGTRPETLAQGIQQRFKVGKSRANLVARDQLSKLHGQVNQARQQALGIEEYVWQTSEDERVRDTHAANNGKTFRWDTPPPTGNPGEDFQCRCTGSPKLPDWMTQDTP